MKKIIFSTMIASLLAFVGCQNEELVNENNTDNSGKKVILTANIQGAADSRVALTPDTDANDKPIVKVDWRTFDSTNPETFAVYDYNEYNSPTTFTQLSGNVFEGTLPESTNGYCAYYNYDLWTRIWETHKFQQDGTLREQDVLMYAEFDEDATSIEFDHLTAILKPTFTLGGESINSTITDIELDGLTLGEMDVAITVTRTSQEMPLAEDIYMTIPFYLYWEYSSFNPGGTFTFSVKAGGKDYTGSFTIPQIDNWYPCGKLFTATIELTEVLSAEYIWKSDITASESVEGEGTEASPYLIHSANDLQWMIDQVNTNGVTGKYYRLTHDLEIDSEEGATWTPIGTATSPFLGNFDGGGHTISGEMHAGSTNLIGFFGYNAGTISNLKNAAEVKDCRTLMPASIEYSAIGSIAGYSKGKIIHCENSGNVTAPSFITTTYTGGICGYQYRDNDETIALITECKNSGAVTGVAGDGNATGGIVGRSDGNIYNALIMACENAGSVTTGDKIGGICGLAEGPTAIVACLNTGDAGVGGIFGGDEYYDLNGCCTTKGYIGSDDVDEDCFFACYTFDEKYASKDKYVDYSDRERVEEIVGPWNVEDHINEEETEMNYVIVQMNSWHLEYPCNWHWEVGEVEENYIPKLVEDAPLGIPL